MRNLAAEQAAMRARHAKRKPKVRAPRAPKLMRGVYVAPVRGRSKVCDFAELQQLLCAFLRSPKTKATDFHKLLEIGTRYGLVLPNIRPIPAEEAEVPNGRQDLSPELREVLRMEKEMRERKKDQETKKTQ